jgi:CHAT domain-containing protein/tetratricopeptide (TPR) repeat protein
MFERFTEKAVKAVMLAQEEAQCLGYREVATVQLLLGLMRGGTDLAAQVLGDAGVNLESVRIEVEKIQGRGAGYHKDIGYNQHTRAVFDLSLAEAEQLKDSELDTQHLLLGLLRQAEGGAIKVLRDLGVDPNQLRTQVLRKLAEQGHPTASQFLPSPPPPNPNGTNSINEAHLALIQKILENPEGSEAQFVRNHPGIIAPELIESVASILEKNPKGAEVLRGLLTPISEEKTEATDNLPEGSVTVPEPIEISSLPEFPVTVPEPIQLRDPPQDIEPIIDVPAPTNQEMEKFIFQLVRVTFESKADEQIVYQFFRENLDHLNDKLPEVFRNWWLSKFTHLDQDQKLKLAKRILEISTLIRKFEGGSRGTNLEIALTGYNIVTSIFAQAEYPENWAKTQNCLGLTYLEREQENREENLKHAIACFTAALVFYNQEQFPKERKVILGSLRKATTEIGNLSVTQEKLDMMPQNSERILGYYTLIEQLLRTPQNQHQTILDDSSELLDIGLVEMMRARGEAEKNRGNIQDGELLIAIADKVNERLGFSSSTAQVNERLGFSSSTAYAYYVDEPPMTNDGLLVVSSSEDTERQQTYRNLIDDVLRSPAQASVILMSNSDLLDAGLVQMIEELVAEYREQNEVPIADFLQDLATGITDLFNNPEWVQQREQIIDVAGNLGIDNPADFLRTMNTQMFSLMLNLSLAASPEEYLNFLGVLFNVMGESKFNPQVVYPILQANLDKLDDNFALILQGYVSFLLSQNSPELSTGIAAGLMGFSNLIIDFPLGNKAINIEIAISCYELATTVFTRESFPEQWAAVQNNLGIAYSQRIKGDRADNLEQAIIYYQKALQVRTKESLTIEWAETQFNLGFTHLQLIRGDRADNLELVIQFTRASLTVYTSSTFPEKWGRAQSNLGEAYRNRIHGDRAENLELAIECFNAALSVEHPPNVKATIQNNLGVAYSERIRGERSENLEQAFRYYEATLTVYTPSTFPFDWARTQTNLACAYFYRIRGIKAENLEQGIQASQSALTIYTKDNFPEQWALTQLNLSNIYVARISGQKADNIEKAIQACTDAFIVLTPESFPQKWAEGQLTLGNAYSQRILGNVADNWEKAIGAYKCALALLTCDPDKWGDIQHNLSRAYMNRIHGVKADNLEQAVQFGEAALTVRTRNGNPEKWAESQDNLARVYSGRIRGEKADSLEDSIQACNAALNIYTPESFPEGWARLQNLLGDLYIERIRGEKAENIELAIQALVAAGTIYTFDNFPELWANNHHSLSTAYRERIRGERADNLERSLEACESSLTVYTRENFPERWAGSQVNRGLAYWRRLRGDHAENMEQAIGSCQAALTIYTREDFPTDWALTQANLGGMFFERTLGDVAENLELSIQVYEASLTVYTQEAFAFNWGMTQSNLSNAYRHRIKGNRDENINKSIQACEAALSVHKRETSPYYWAQTKLSLGNTYTSCFTGNREENLEKAIAAYSDALTIFTEPNFPQQWAMIQNNLGDLYRQRIKDNEKENLKRAIVYFNNALKVSEFTCDPHEKARVLYNLGFTYFKAKKLYLAHKALKDCIETVESLRGKIISGEQGKRKNSEQSFTFSQLIVKVCIEIAEKYKNSKYYAKALEYVERNKARYLVELLANRDILPKGNVSEEVLNELKRLRQEIATEQRRLENYRNTENIIISNKYHQESNNSYVAIIPDRTHLNQLQQQLDDLIEREIQPKDPDFSAIQKVKPILFSDIKALLPDNKIAIIEWFFPIPFYQSSLPPLDKYEPDIIGTKLYTFITASESKYPIILSSSLKKYEDLLKWNTEYWQAYSGDNKKTLWENQMEERLKRLADILEIDDIIGRIHPKYDRVILIPHWYLHLYPLHSLPLSNGGCLLDRFTAGVSYAPNCQLLEISPNRKHQNFSQFFAIQNPTDAGANLPYTDIEVEIIRKSFQPLDDVLAKEAAKKEAIDTQRLSSANCVHFSCHAYFSFSHPLESALILAGASKKNVPFNLKKCLTLGEIFELDLSKCCLVSLSACETGIIDPATSHVEYIGLPSGFLYAGSSNVVASLWTVNDLSTTFLMIKLYENLNQQLKETNGLNVPIALRDAQIWLKQVDKVQLKEWLVNIPLRDPLHKAQLKDWLRKPDPNPQPFQSPYYWAGFCAIGQ